MIDMIVTVKNRFFSGFFWCIFFSFFGLIFISFFGSIIGLILIECHSRTAADSGRRREIVVYLLQYACSQPKPALPSPVAQAARQTYKTIASQGAKLHSFCLSNRQILMIANEIKARIISAITKAEERVQAREEPKYVSTYLV